MLKIELYQALFLRTWKESALRPPKNIDLILDFKEIPTIWDVPNCLLWKRVIHPYLINDLIEFALIYRPNWKTYRVRQMVIDAINSASIYSFMRNKSELYTLVL